MSLNNNLGRGVAGFQGVRRCRNPARMSARGREPPSEPGTKCMICATRLVSLSTLRRHTLPRRTPHGAPAALGVGCWVSDGWKRHPLLCFSDGTCAGDSGGSGDRDRVARFDPLRTLGGAASGFSSCAHAPNLTFPACDRYREASLQPGSASMMTDGPGVRMMWVRRRPALASRARYSASLRSRPPPVTILFISRASSLGRAHHLGRCAREARVR